jgi:hypothetical protein
LWYRAGYIGTDPTKIYRKTKYSPWSSSSSFHPHLPESLLPHTAQSASAHDEPGVAANLASRFARVRLRDGASTGAATARAALPPCRRRLRTTRRRTATAAATCHRPSQGARAELASAHRNQLESLQIGPVCWKFGRNRNWHDGSWSKWRLFWQLDLKLPSCHLSFFKGEQ